MSQSLQTRDIVRKCFEPGAVQMAECINKQGRADLDDQSLVVI